MRTFSRRTTLKLGAAGLAVASLPYRKAFADAYVRYEASTENGQAMLAKYEAAVGLMKQISATSGAGHPCGWTFWWYTHMVPVPDGGIGKCAEVAALPVNQRPLANLVWDTCQFHHPNDACATLSTEERMFLPWHRMFVYYFEQICRHVLNDTTFTLPYWNYNNADTASIPASFRNPDSPLYYAHRQMSRSCGGSGSYCINDGDALTGLTLNDLKWATYESFSKNIDLYGLHSLVHGKVGDSSQPFTEDRGMASLYFAANDPIFWLHHSNIDRLWASWNAGDPSHLNPDDDPSWTDQQFTFVQPTTVGCVSVTAPVGNFSDIANLGYSYDRLEEIPPGPQLKDPAALAGIRPLLRSNGLIELKGPYSRIPLHTVGEAIPLGRRLQQGKRFYLLLDHLMANKTNVVLYDVYFDGNIGQPDLKSRPACIISFLDAEMSHIRGMQHDQQISFDVTDALLELKAGGALHHTVGLVVVPESTPKHGGNPIIGSIAVVEA